jgi:hypothetical protein
LPVEKIQKCMGNPEADVENEVLKTEQELQVILLIWFSLCCSFHPIGLQISILQISFLN